MKKLVWGVAVSAILILVGAGAYAEEAAPRGEAPDGYIFPVNRKSAEALLERKEKREQAAEERKAREEEKLAEQEKKAKVDKLQRKTGRPASSWQVINR